MYRNENSMIKTTSDTISEIKHPIKNRKYTETLQCDMHP